MSFLGAVLADEREGLGAAAGGLLQVHGFVVLVHDFAAENFFEHVLETHDARDGAELFKNRSKSLSSMTLSGMSCKGRMSLRSFTSRFPSASWL